MKIRGNTVGTTLKPEKAVVKCQNLTPEEQAQARKNINAMDIDDFEQIQQHLDMDIEDVRENTVRHDMPQALTEGEKAQARANIGVEDAIEEFMTREEVTTKNGSVVAFECSSGETIQVNGDTTETVTLAHQGKNFAPVVPGQSFTEIYTPNDDGTFSMHGLSGSEVYFWHPTVGSERNRLLPAGTYTLHTNLPCSSGGFIIRSWNGPASTAGGANLAVGVCSSKAATFILSEPTWCSLILAMNAGADEYDGDGYYLQLEMGDMATDFEKYARKEYSVTYPATVEAIDGTNILYDDHGTVLTASHATKVAFMNDEVLKAILEEKLKFDPAPYNIPILYLAGDTSAMTKDNAVNLAYVYGDLSGTASVKWQGSSSVTFPKKNYTIKFDQKFEAVEGWGTQNKYCLKANWIDFSHSRNVVSAKLWGQIVAKRNPQNATLAACPNYGAVDGFPCCIVINGNYMGVYTFNIPKDGWMMNMGAGTQECILCADSHVTATQFKAAATFNGDFDVEYITDENNTAWALASLNNLINACVNTDGANLDTTIAAMLDWQSAIDYYIFIGLIRGNDMIDKNYLLSTYDGTKWFFGAYDIDSTYGLHTMGTHFFSVTFTEEEGAQWNMNQLAARNRVFELIKMYKLDALKARYKELRETVMSEDNVSYMFRNFAGSIPKPVLDEDNRVWPTIPNTNVNNVQQVIDWYRLRCQYIDAEVNAM